MSVYKTLRDVNFDGTIVPTGAEVDLSNYDEAVVQRFLDKGSIVEVSVEAKEVTAPAPEPTQPPVKTPGEPTPEQLAKDFQDAGVEGSPNVPQPN